MIVNRRTHQCTHGIACVCTLCTLRVYNAPMYTRHGMRSPLLVTISSQVTILSHDYLISSPTRLYEHMTISSHPLLGYTSSFPTYPSPTRLYDLISSPTRLYEQLLSHVHVFSSHDHFLPHRHPLLSATALQNPACCATRPHLTLRAGCQPHPEQANVQAKLPKTSRECTLVRCRLSIDPASLGPTRLCDRSL